MDANTCDGSSCFVYAPTKGEEIVDLMKAVQSKSILDAEIVFSLDKVLPERTIRISNLTMHGITNSEVRKQFTTCLTELVKKEVADIQKSDATKKK